MLRSKQILGRLVLAVVLVFQTATPTQLVLIGIGATATATTVACGPDTLSKLHDTLNKTAKSFEAAIDTNGRLYEGGLYGAKGSPEAIRIRQQVASYIHDGNEHLITALKIAKGLTKETFEGGKVAVLEALARSTAAIGTTGNRTMDLVLQATIGFINNAVAIIQAFSASVVDDLPKALPAIEQHINTFQDIAEDAL